MDLRGLQRIEIRELCYFVALAEELHFARAAERVGINESPLSKAITLLEYRLRIRLFHRTRRRTLLTEVGAALLPQAKTILSEVDRARKDVAAYAAGRKGRLRIGISDGLPVARIGRLLEQCALEDPQVEFTVEHYSPVEQIRELRRGGLDVGLAPSLASDPLGIDLDLTSILLRHDSMVAAMRPGHVLAEQAVVRSLEAGTGPYIVVGDSSTGAGEIGQLIQPTDKAETIIQYAYSLDILLSAVLAGRGVGLLGADQVHGHENDGFVFRPIGLSKARITIHLIHRREENSPVISRFVERAQRMV